MAHAFELLSRSLQHAQDWYDRADRLQTVPPTIQECQRLLKDWKGMDLRCGPASHRAAVVMVEVFLYEQDSCDL